MTAELEREAYSLIAQYNCELSRSPRKVTHDRTKAWLVAMDARK